MNKTGYILITIESGYAENIHIRRSIGEPKNIMELFIRQETLKAIEEQGKEYKELVISTLEKTIDKIKKGELNIL